MRRALLLVAALAACGPGPTSRLPDVRLATLAGPLGPSLASCPVEKCLTVLVAPWCGVCHAVTPDIVRLRRHLDKVGVPSRVVVGLDGLEAIKGFAALFGPDTLLDPGRAVSSRGVPLFLVTDREGRVTKALEGFPSQASSPEELAAVFGLP